MAALSGNATALVKQARSKSVREAELLNLTFDAYCAHRAYTTMSPYVDGLELATKSRSSQESLDQYVTAYILFFKGASSQDAVDAFNNVLLKAPRDNVLNLHRQEISQAMKEQLGKDQIKFASYHPTPMEKLEDALIASYMIYSLIPGEHAYKICAMLLLAGAATTSISSDPAPMAVSMMMASSIMFWKFKPELNKKEPLPLLNYNMQ